MKLNIQQVQSFCVRQSALRHEVIFIFQSGV